MNAEVVFQEVTENFDAALESEQSGIADYWGIGVERISWKEVRDFVVSSSLRFRFCIDHSLMSIRLIVSELPENYGLIITLVKVTKNKPRVTQPKNPSSITHFLKLSFGYQSPYPTVVKVTILK